MKWLLAFVAGFVSTIVFHLGLLQLMHMAGLAPSAAWHMNAVPPLGVPSVVSLAFWGGVWGIALWAVVRNMTGTKRWV